MEPATNALDRHWYNARDYNPAAPWDGFRPNRSALVLIDLINWQAAPDGFAIEALRATGLGECADYITRRCTDQILPRLRELLHAARAAGVRIIHARVASRQPDYEDMLLPLRPYARGAEAQDGSWACEPLPGLWEPETDFSVVKTGSSAFARTELADLLARLEVETILYAGVLTNACVMLTAAAGFELGYRQYLIRDCTGAFTENDQAEAERLIDIFMAKSVTAAEAVAAIQAALPDAT